MTQTAKLLLSENQWRERLSEIEFQVLRQAATEIAFSSILNNEKRQGSYKCAGCGLELFVSDFKFDSGSGWPSFFDVLPSSIGTSSDFTLLHPRTEFHCTRCHGHLGHVFNDGPQPTGLRYCTNGVALKFVATSY